MKFEITDWRFEITWDGLRCRPLEPGREKTAKKFSARGEQRKPVSETNSQVIGLTVETQNLASLHFDKQEQRKGPTNELD
ncbi:MAG: hypothetical protein J2P21_00635 [Chloracidobacterium sp.]|nr:hypothetical protein [Chloracidobacterium sp.]